LWGPIWGYVSLEGDANTIFAASFSHKGETPGLGAEITTSNFQTPFTGKQIFRDGQFRSIAVMKAGVKSETQDQVDAISGGTITSKGVEAMLYDCLSVYEAFLKTIKED
jgi:Na+-transporting NADH:ubiquinone oxidoreductase subunit C